MPTTTPASTTVVPEQPKTDPAALLAESTQVVTDAERRLKENDKRMGRYYATPEQVNEATADQLKLAVVSGLYGDSKSREEKALAGRAGALMKQVSKQQRGLYASSLEQVFVRNGLDVDVTASGKAKDQLRLKYVLMSKPLVYKFQNEMEIQQQARTYGFKRIVYSDGYDESWTVDL